MSNPAPHSRVAGDSRCQVLELTTLLWCGREIRGTGAARDMWDRAEAGFNLRNSPYREPFLVVAI